MLDGSLTYLHDPIVKYLEERGVKINLRTGIRDIVYETDSSGKSCKVTGLHAELKEFDAVVAAVDLPGAKKLIPEPFRVYPEFDRIYELDAVPIATVQLRFDGPEAASPCPSRRRRGTPSPSPLTNAGWVTELQDQEKMKDTTGDLSDGAAPRHRQLTVQRGRRVLVLRGSGAHVPGRVLQGGEGSRSSASWTRERMGVLKPK